MGSAIVAHQAHLAHGSPLLVAFWLLLLVATYGLRLRSLLDKARERRLNRAWDAAYAEAVQHRWPLMMVYDRTRVFCA